MHAVDPEFVVQMRAGRQARLTNVSDDLSLINETAALDAASESRKVPIKRAVGITMANLNQIPITGADSYVEDFAVGSRTYRGSKWGRVVDASVRANRVEYRMTSRQRETGADAREFDRRAKKRLMHRFALIRIIRRTPIWSRIKHRAHALTLIDEFGGENAILFDELLPFVNLFIDDAEVIVWL